MNFKSSFKNCAKYTFIQFFSQLELKKHLNYPYESKGLKFWKMKSYAWELKTFSH